MLLIPFLLLNKECDKMNMNIITFQKYLLGNVTLMFNLKPRAVILDELKYGVISLLKMTS